MKSRIQRFANIENGVTAIEYGLIASLIVVAIATAVTLVAMTLSELFNTSAGLV